jgi:type VI secretion system secreted protein Hcp
MAVDMFIKIGDIKGESSDEKHKEQIDVLAWSWGMSNAGTFHTGTGGGAGKVNVQDLSFTKYMDKASMNLMEACCTGKHYPDATLYVRKAGDKPLEYLTIKMSKVLITSFQSGGSGGEERLTESVTLNFASYVTEYKPQGDTGGGKGSVFAKYDMAMNKQG